MYNVLICDDDREILNSIEMGEHHTDADKVKMSIGTEIIPYIRKDNTDRNRTSPFAFTGNKFEFRMLGSASSISLTQLLPMYLKILRTSLKTQPILKMMFWNLLRLP